MTELEISFERARERFYSPRRVNEKGTIEKRLFFRTRRADQIELLRKVELVPFFLFLSSLFFLLNYSFSKYYLFLLQLLSLEE